MNWRFGNPTFRTQKNEHFYLSLTTLLILFSCSLSLAEIQESPKSAKEWEVVGEGPFWQVYISPIGLKDKSFLIQMLTEIRKRHYTKFPKKMPLNIHFYDAKKFTPKKMPMDDQQMLHWRGRYTFNPNKNFEEFVWIQITNPKSSPPDFKEIRDKIRPDDK